MRLSCCRNVNPSDGRRAHLNGVWRDTRSHEACPLEGTELPDSVHDRVALLLSIEVPVARIPHHGPWTRYPCAPQGQGRLGQVEQGNSGAGILCRWVFRTVFRQGLMS